MTCDPSTLLTGDERSSTSSKKLPGLKKSKLRFLFSFILLNRSEARPYRITRVSRRRRFSARTV